MRFRACDEMPPRRHVRTTAGLWLIETLCCQVFSFEMYESIPFKELTVSTNSTICATCYIDIKITHHIGLTVDPCWLRLTANDSVQLIRVRAVPTPGANSRVAVIKFDNTYVDSVIQRGFGPDVRVTDLFWLVRFLQNRGPIFKTS